MFEAFDRLEAEMDKKDALRKKLLDRAEESRAAENAVHAEIETLWEIGHFSDQKPERDELNHGLIVRMRKDALLASMNTGDILTEIASLKDQAEANGRAIRNLRYTVTLIAVFVLYVAFRGHS